MKKKLVVLIALLCITFILFLSFYFGKHSYTIEYMVDDVNVVESFNKKDGYYKFVFTYNGTKYESVAINKYSNKRRLVTKVETLEKDDMTCLDFSTNHVSLYPICEKDGSYYSSYYNKHDDFNGTKAYENIKINNLNDKTYLLWNYHNFIYLNSKTQEKISLFKKDIYNLSLVYQMADYLLIPDYDKDYIFDKLYYINSTNGKVKTVDLRYDVYFDSYFLGHDKNKVYLYDQKEEQEYYIDMKKAKIYKTDYKILVDNKWEKTTNQKLKNNKLAFTTKEIYNYTLDNDKLYASIIDSSQKILVTDRLVSKIIKTDGLDVYYISKDTLYYFNPAKGEQALLSYSEWEFNNNNMIYIF